MGSFFRRLQKGLKSSRAEVKDEPGELSGAWGIPDAGSDDIIGPLEFPGDCGGPADGVDLVFVHGLRGSRLKTWSHGDIFWPQHLLMDDLKNARVITWGYDASIINAFKPASKESLFGHAETLLNDLARLRRGVTRPIIFICHSLGGLVVKDALVTSASYKSHNRHPALGEVYGSTIGVVFMGTPHRGSSKASYGEIAVNVAKLSLRRTNTQLLRTLKPDSQILERLRDSFTTISNDMAIVCIREELPTGAGMIVPESSAVYDGFNVTHGAIHANHMDMARFATRNKGYERTLNHIESILSNKLAKFEQANKVIEARKDAILNALKFSTIDDREEGIDEAYAETCSWVWDNPPESKGAPARTGALRSWLQNTEPTLWISGKAGCGKSTLIKDIYFYPDTKAELSHSPWLDGKELILAAHFFHDRGSDDQKSREGMLRNILFQVLRSRRDLIPMVFSQWQFFDDDYSQDLASKLKMLPEFLSWRHLTKALFSMLGHLQDSRICLFLDALDEYRMTDKQTEYTEEQLDLIYDGENEDEAWGRSTWITDGHKEIAQFIQRLRSHRNVKCCISSRELVVFEHVFGDVPRIIVHTHTAHAISEYCQGRLTKEAPRLEDLSKFVQTITDRSSGVFLWVRLVIDLLVDGYIEGNSTGELWEAMEKLPSRLGGKNGIYMQMMQSIKPESLAESKRLFQLVMRLGDHHHSYEKFDIITLFLASEGHLQAGSMRDLRVSSDDYDLKTWDEWEGRWKTLQNRLKSRCAGLLEGTENVQFMHQTAKQFLSRKSLQTAIFHNAVGFTTEDEMDLALLSGLIRRLKCCSEAVATHRLNTGTKDDGLSISFHNTADPYPGANISERAIALLDGVVSVAEEYEDTMSTTLHHDFIRLFDELDHVGDRLSRDLRARKEFVDSGWLGVYVIPQFYRLPLGPTTLLGLAIQHRITPYVETKMSNGMVPRDQLPYLLSVATWSQPMGWRGTHSYQVKSGSIWIIESLLQEGADPNQLVIESNMATGLRGGRTPWTGFLGNHFYSTLTTNRLLLSWVKSVIMIAKVFLKYGADPAARWDFTFGREPATSSEVVTPEIMISKLLDSEPLFKPSDPEPWFRKDLEEILGILRLARKETVIE